MVDYTPRQLREVQHNKKIAPRANKVWGRESLVGKMRLERRSQMFIEGAQLEKGKKVLEIGCGTGEFTRYLARSKALITAIDIFQEFLDQAEKKGTLPGVMFQCSRAETLEEFPTSYFDVVCGVSILHHLDVDPALESIYRVLKPRGKIVFSEPNMLNPQIMLQKNIPLLKKWLGDSPDETAFFCWQIKSLLKKKHFKNISVAPFDFLHPSLPDFLANTTQRIAFALERIPLIKEWAGSLFIMAKKPANDSF